MASIDCTKRVNIAKRLWCHGEVTSSKRVPHLWKLFVRHKEVDVGQDLCLLTETMMEAQLYVLTAKSAHLRHRSKLIRRGLLLLGHGSGAIVDSFDLGAQILNSGKFREFIRTTTWDPAAGYPVAAPLNIWCGEGNNEEEVSTWDTSVDKRGYWAEAGYDGADARGGGLGLSGNAWAGYDGADTGGGGCGAGMWKAVLVGQNLPE
ncbi:hypothetical protein B0H14DRAFT_2644363 [Mycena olivaceomarginata]|nr:hypothetical protein B0H14DRAFT_2644363 [Mycena olivaceomarginata]